MLVDSHCHLSFEDLGSYNISNSHDIIKQAKNSGIVAILDIILSQSSIVNALNFSHKFPNFIYNAFGVHPCYVDHTEFLNFSSNELKQIIVSNSNFIAIGEIGLDYFHASNNKNKQIDMFEMQCQLACDLNLPVVIHTRNAHKDTCDILKQFVKSRGLRGVIHCFSEGEGEAYNYLDLGFYISFSGILTFKKAEAVKKAAISVPLNSILVETDSPYLAPSPFRGKPNCPSYVTYIAEHLALLKQLSLSEVCKATTNNFSKLFNLAPLTGDEG